MHHWTTRTSPTALDDGEVHVFRASLANPERAARLRGLLARDEIERARRFRTADLRRRFAVARGCLRAILGQYLDRDPARLEFRIGAHGKPFLGTAADGLEFNVSQSGEIALYALTRGRQVGVDVERHDSRRVDDDIIRRFFAAGEMRALGALPPAERERAFFDCWTRKEAFVKAVGEGLSFPLDAFEVSVAAGDARLLSIRGDGATAAGWTIADVCPAAGYSGAVAIDDDECLVDCFTWPDQPRNRF